MRPAKKVDFPKNHVMTQFLRAIEMRQVLFRIWDPERGQSLTFVEMDAVRLRRFMRLGRSIVVAPCRPLERIALRGLTKAGLRALAAQGLEPAALIQVGHSPHEPGEYSAWFRLRERVTQGPLMTMVARLAAGIAGLDPRAAHWQLGTHVPNTVVPESGRRAYLVAAPGTISTGGAALLQRAREILAQQAEQRRAAAAVGLDPLSDGLALVEERQTIDEVRAVYAQQAALVRSFGGMDEAVVDRSLALAAFRAGATEERVRQLLSVSPVAEARRASAVAQAAAGHDLDQLAAGRRAALSPEAQAALRAVRDAAVAAGKAEATLYATQVIRDVLHEPGLQRTAAAMIERGKRLADMIELARGATAAARALRKAGQG